MAVVAGDIQEITFNHPELGSGVIYPKSQEEGTYDPGGFRTSDDDAGVDGGGRSVDQMQRTRAFFQVPITHDMNGKRELDIIDKMAGHPEPAEWTTQHANGDIRRMKGKPVGSVQGNVGAGTMDLKVAGGGKLEKIN